MWHDDGSITGRFPPHIKGTFFDVNELGFLFRSLSDHMDYDIGDIVASGKYHDAREYMAALVEKMKEASGGKLPPDEELYRMMLYPICIWGIAEVEFSSIEAERMIIKVKEPYSIPLLCGDVAGVADVVTGREHMATWEGDEREGVMTVVPAAGFAGVSGLIDEESRYGLKHEAEELECERCEECGAPKGVSGLFKWERERCRIEERFSGRRYCFNNTQGITAVLVKLAGELGEDIEQKMVEIARDYSRSLYEDIAGKPESNGGRGGMGLETHLESFPYRGWGRVTELSEREKEWVVATVNPYSEIMLSGRIWGMVEASSGLDLRIADTTADGMALRLTFTPS
jgi:Arc/MetJ-type ribon-helix-helix transcriptional regulator